MSALTLLAMNLKQVLETTSLDSAPFDYFTGIDVWRHLVKVCSGLDSFIMGELQVMSQFRGSVAWHKKHGLISDLNGSFDHVVSANRMIRREFGFNQTTESTKPCYQCFTRNNPIMRQYQQ